MDCLAITFASRREKKPEAVKSESLRDRAELAGCDMQFTKRSGNICSDGPYHRVQQSRKITVSNRLLVSYIIHAAVSAKAISVTSSSVRCKSAARMTSSACRATDVPPVHCSNPNVVLS